MKKRGKRESSVARAWGSAGNASMHLYHARGAYDAVRLPGHSHHLQHVHFSLYDAREALKGWCIHGTELRVDDWRWQDNCLWSTIFDVHAILEQALDYDYADHTWREPECDKRHQPALLLAYQQARDRFKHLYQISLIEDEDQRESAWKLYEDDPRIIESRGVDGKTRQIIDIDRTWPTMMELTARAAAS